MEEDWEGGSKVDVTTLYRTSAKLPQGHTVDKRKEQVSHICKVVTVPHNLHDIVQLVYTE